MLLAGLLFGCAASAQTALYKAFVGRTGINAACIEDFPIGNGVKVTITMLEAGDSSSFRRLKRCLRALPYSGPKSERPGDSADHDPLKRCVYRPVRDFVHELDSSPESSHVYTFEGSMATAFLSHIQNLDMKISLEKESASASSEQARVSAFYCRAADPLPGDRGLYLICCSEDMMTSLVFHCPNDEVYAQSISYVLKKIVRRAAGDE